MTWKFAIKIYLSSFDYFNAVSGVTVLAADADAGAVAKWNILDLYLAQRIIVTTISPKLMMHIITYVL